ncbi:hypothetical protein LPJ61_000231 [Coemansia biformis]|uniref:RING-type E3 ubiquitin transferase n=1 Tax=Coemansia biformis TaxID=1286918 RepID=A0A9W7YJ29_9FUNG|nr:hypothetical protein LPJ61_000231 [Coemansia biformis]
MAPPKSAAAKPSGPNSTSSSGGGGGGDKTRQPKGKQPSRREPKGNPVQPEQDSSPERPETGDDGAGGGEAICFICADTVMFYAVGECDHRTCFRCNLRLRALFKSKGCPYCKTELETVIYTRDADVAFAELQARPQLLEDQSLGIKFDCNEARDATEQARRLSCPHRKCQHVASDGWKGLKDHARTKHALQFCDLCLKNKKSFPHEHRLFSKPQLRSHYARGDGAGFTGHPECEFCRMSFYDHDQLFEHCRSKHEQCFLCVRNGAGRHVYYANYQSLEDHFNADHVPCKQASCLERKFVVFENELDLQSHELEEHGGAIVGQRARREAKQVNVDFRYAANRGAPAAIGSGSRSRQRPAASGRRPATMTVSGPDAAGVSIAGRARPASFGRISGNEPRPPAAGVSDRQPHGRSATPLQSSESEPEPQPETLWPTLGPGPSVSDIAQASRPAGGAIRDQAPTGFGNLSAAASNNPAHPAPAVLPAETMAQHQELLQRVSAYLSHREQPVERFRQLTTRYKNGAMPAGDYVQNCWLLFLTVPGKNAKEMIQKTIRSVAALLPDADLQSSLQKALDRHRIEQQQFPALTPLVGSKSARAAASAPPSRVLVIKPGAKPSSPRSGWSGSSLSQPTPRVPAPSTAPKPSQPLQAQRAAVSAAPAPASTPAPAALPESAFPSLGAGSGVAARTHVHRQSGGPSHASYSAKFAQPASSSGPRLPAAQSAAPEFPNLPQASRPRRHIPPLDPHATSAWEQPASLASRTANARASSGSDKKQAPSAKGKQVLYYVG